MAQELERRREVLAATEAAIDAWVDWQEHDRDALIVPEELRQAWSDMVVIWATGSIPADCRELARAVEAFDAQYLAPWLAQMESSGQQAIMPPNAFWAALEGIARGLAEVTAPAQKPLEPIADLVAQGVSHAQIAKIYGFRDGRGNWSEQMVREELAKPGTHTGAGWVDPRQQRKAGRLAAREEAVKRARQAIARKIARREATPPESLADLIEQGVSLVQIARIFRTTEAAVLEQCRAEGLQEPAAAPPSASMAGIFATEEELERAEAFSEDAERRRAERAAETVVVGDGDTGSDDGAPMTLEQQIVACHLDGLSVEDTVQTLQHLAGVTAAKVRSVVKRYDKDPAAFGMAERIPARRH